jgi:hypothetical protein
LVFGICSLGQVVGNKYQASRTWKAAGERPAARVRVHKLLICLWRHKIFIGTILALAASNTIKIRLLWGQLYAQDRGMGNRKECAYINYHFGSGESICLLEPFWLWRNQMLLGYAPSGINYMHKIDEWATERSVRTSITILPLAAQNLYWDHFGFGDFKYY